MGFFSSSTEEREVGTCISCGKVMIGKFDKKTGELKKKPEVMLEDGTLLCAECIKSKDLITNEVENKKTLEAVKSFYASKNLVAPDEFFVSQRVHREGHFISPRKELVYLELDEKHELINIPVFDQGIMFDDLMDRIYPFSDILDFKVVEDGSQIMEGNSFLGGAAGGVIGAVVGGEVLGGFGALFGTALGDHRMKGKCKELQIKIVVNDVQENTRYIDLIGRNSEYKDVDRDGPDYKDAMEKAEECLSLLTIILKRNAQKRQQQGADSLKNAVAEAVAQAVPQKAAEEDEASKIIANIKKLAELKDAGILSEEEFAAKKKELMARL